MERKQSNLPSYHPTAGHRTLAVGTSDRHN
jgi:hypothetical protein